MGGYPATSDLENGSARFIGGGGAPMKHIWQAMKCAVFISWLSLVVPLQATESESMKSLPKSEDIFTIAINPIPSGPASTTRYFTPESLPRGPSEFQTWRSRNESYWSSKGLGIRCHRSKQ